MNIGTFLKTSRTARKVFGKREIEIIIRQLNGMRLTQSEKNRISRDIKPKFSFIRECSEFKDQFGLKKNQANKKIIDESADILLEDESSGKIESVLLAGSFADNTFTAKSDIDICVVFEKDISVREATLFRKRLLGRLNSKIDLQVFNILPLKIKDSIARNHKILYKRESFDDTNFILRVTRNYQDYRRHLDEAQIAG